jgi:hypothetical protein
MTEQLVPMTEEEQIHRNKLLRGKRRGIRLILLLLAPIICAIIYLLQTNEDLSGTPLYVVTGVMTLILLGAILMYHRFARLINLDMQSHEKIVTTGVVVRANFYGNNVYATRVYGSNGQKYLTINVDGRWITLSGIQLKRLLPEVWQANRIPLGETFIVEITPFGRHLMRLDRAELAA